MAPTAKLPTISADGFLDLLDRLLPSSYLDPLKEVGPGYEILQAYSKLFERCGAAISNADAQAFFATATGGAKATGTATFTRASTATGIFAIKAGTVLQTGGSGRQFVTTQDATFGAGDLSVNAQIMAIAPGYEYNVSGEKVIGSITLPADIDTIIQLLTDPPFADQSITATATATTGGRPALLDALGADVNTPRAGLAETDAQYRVRVRSLPDNISPAAVRRSLATIFAQYTPNVDPVFIETWQPSYQTAYDMPADLPGALSNTFVYDDPLDSPYPGSGFTTRRAAGFFNRWLDDVEAGGTFYVVAPQIPAQRDVGMAYDDPSDQAVAPTPSSYVSPGSTAGQRGISAYDVDGSLSPEILQGAYDGFDPAGAQAYLNVYQMLQRIKAAGTVAVLELAGQ